MLIKICGRVRGLFAGNYPENKEDEQLIINNRGDLAAAQSLPERAELVRLGQSWGAQIPTASAFTNVAAWPTTRAELLLCNAEDKGSGIVYAIDRVWFYGISSMAAAQPVALLGQVVPAALNIAAATDNTAILRQSLSGKLANYNGRATLALANTAFAVANHWTTLGNGVMAPMTTNLGANAEALVFGRYLIPPGAAFAIAAVAGTAAGTAIVGVEWHEVNLITK